MKKLLFILFSLIIIRPLYAGTAEDSPRKSSGMNFSLKENFNSYTNTEWKEGFKNKTWNVNFTGFGTAGIQQSESSVIFLSPQESSSPAETHAGLITSKDEFENIYFEAKIKTVKQLRKENPNTWETAWLLWNFKDNKHFYYFILKTNGWELGKEDPEYPGAQRFLATGDSPSLNMQEWHAVRISQSGNIITIFVDEKEITVFEDKENPYYSGKAGLYCEDSHVQFDDIQIAVQ